jgi:hypothetical protein
MKKLNIREKKHHRIVLGLYKKTELVLPQKHHNQLTLINSPISA